MAQRAEPAVHIHIGNGADTLGIVPDPCSQLVLPVSALDRLQAYIHVLAFPAHLEHAVLAP